jgi:ATP adenylyltransferase
MAPRKRGAKRPESAPCVTEARLWAPWRYEYLQRAIAGPKVCIFCFGRLSEAERQKRLVLFENRYAAVMLNRYPYINGHIMVAPRQHLASPELVSTKTRAVINDLIAASVKLMRAQLKPDGFNIGANIGRDAGAGFADHMHWHIVPRWEGDGNFISVLASTRVLSQSLEDSFKQLRPLFKTVGADLS